MRILYWLLTALTLALVVVGFGFFGAPENANVSTEDLVAWYYQAAVVGVIVGGLSGLGFGTLVPRSVVQRRGESPSRFGRRVVFWGMGGAVVGVVLTMLVTLQLAYGRADWQLAPSERLSLVAGSGRYFGVLGAAWMFASIAYAILVSSRSWNGRSALTGR